MCRLFAVFFIVAQLLCMFEAKPSSYLAKMPASCENQNFCYEKTDEYPQQEFDKIISGLNIEAVLIKKTEQRTDDPSNEGYQPCRPTNPNLSLMYYIVDTNGDTRYVAQNDVFKQEIRVVKCKYPGQMTKPVLPFDKSLACQYNVSCVEDLVSVNFLVLKHDRSGVEVATIKDGLPMACSCRYSYPAVSTPESCPKEGAEDEEYAELLRKLDAEMDAEDVESTSTLSIFQD